MLEFYSPLDKTLEEAKTTNIVSSTANDQAGIMERVNWDNQSVPPKIIALVGKFFCNWWRLLVDKNGSFYADAVLQGFHSSVIQ